MKDINGEKKAEMLKSAEEASNKAEITDQAKFIIDQKIEVLKTIN